MGEPPMATGAEAAAIGFGFERSSCRFRPPYAVRTVTWKSVLPSAMR